MTREAPIQQQANDAYERAFGEDGYLRELIEQYDEAYEDEPLEELQEGPLCIEKIITDHRNEEIQWEILLGTGGPARRVLVTTSLEGTVERAEFQFQDWFQPWTTAEDQDEKIVRRYAELVGYYEEVH